MEPEVLKTVTEFASLAPSVHNSQPWRFVAGPQSLEIHLDPSRALTFLDPTGRQMHISCGAVIEFTRLAFRSLGYACTVRLLPDSGNSTLAAKLVVGSVEPATPAEQRMIDAVARRYTDRGPYADDPVSYEVLQRLREAVAERRSWLKVIDKPDLRLSVVRLLAEAEEAECSDPRYRDELADWHRDRPAADGLPDAATRGWDVERRVSDVPLRDFSGHDSHPHPGADVPPAVEKDTIVLLGTDRDDAMSWLQAGRALACLLLTLTDADLVSQPLGQVLDLPWSRTRLRRELGLVGYPQMLLRVGRGERAPATGRRPAEEVFVSSTSP